MYSVARVLAMVVMGVLFLLSQVLILREFLLAFQGNEFVIGIVLGSWLLLEALGSWLSGRRADRSKDPLCAFVRVQAALSLLLPLTLLVIRANRWLLGKSPWEIVSYLEIWGVSIALLGPLACLNGVAFTYGCRLMAARDPARHHAPGMVYALESLGAFLAGLVFTFLLVGRVHSVMIALCVGAASMGVMLFLLAGSGGRGEEVTETGARAYGVLALHRAVCLLLMVGFVVGAATPVGGRLDRWILQLRWHPLELQESADSVYGNVALLRLDEQYMVYQNGIPTITFPHPDRAALETLVHVPLLAHPEPREVLLVGGGVGGALAEAQKHPLKALYYTELDPLLVRVVEPYATPSVRQELQDPRTRILFQDGRFFLRRAERKVDAVILHVPDPATLQMNRFFTEEFFRLARRVLEPGGIVALSMPGSSSYLSEEILRMNRCVRDTLERVFPHVRVLPGERNLFLAARDVHVRALTPGLLADRLEERGVETSVIRPYHLAYMMDPWQGRWVREALEKTEGTRINRDLTPSLVYYTLAHRNAEVQPGWREVFPVVERLRIFVLLAALLALTLPFAGFAGRRNSGGARALSFAVFSTGFAGMAIEMIVLLTFQSLYGVLYQWIGLLIAAFMAGLASGAFLLTRMLTRIRQGVRFFFRIEALLFAFVLAAAWGIVALHGHLLEKTVVVGTPKWVLLCINLAAGMFVGAEFPLANREALMRTGKGGSRVGGALYALDLAGAWLGAMLVSVLMVPLVGIRNTLFFVAALKACSLFLLHRARPLTPDL